MNKLQLLGILLFFKVHIAAPQADSSVLARGNISDRIFLTYDDFRNNRFVSKEQVVSGKNREQFNFLSQVLDSADFVFIKNNERVVMNSRKIWGFLQNNIFYKNYINELWKVTSFGTISYFVVVIKNGKFVLNNGLGAASGGFVSQGYGSPAGVGFAPGARMDDKLEEYLIDYENGDVIDFNLRNVERLLANDEALTYRFKQLSTKEKKKLAHNFIRQYNTAHPLSFLR